MVGLLQQRGFDIRVRLFYWGEPTEGVTYQFLSASGIPFSSCQFVDTETNVLWLLKEFAASAPDVVIADSVVPALFAAEYLKDARIPVVAILRSDDAFYHGVMDYFVHGPRRRRVSAAVSVSRFLDQCVRASQCNDVRTAVIPSGTPVCEVPDHRSYRPFRVAYVGRLVQEQKRILETVSALTRICLEIPEVEATVFGDGPESCNVADIVKATNSPVKLAGRVEPSEIQKQLLSHHVIVLLSDYEGTPTALLEAMACGVVPVCLQMRSGIPELVQHGITGLIVEDRGDGLVSAIRGLVGNQVYWRQLSQAARTKVAIEYSSERCADLWAALLQSLSINSESRRSVRIPPTLTLPSVHPALAREDYRKAKRSWLKDLLIKAKGRALQLKCGLSKINK
jgi:glycosyltransferase involved in cell wall biosynthesis